jgi:probable DNA metabolism protein
MHKVVLSGPADFAGWRAAARSFAVAGIPPQNVSWLDGDEAPGLFDDAADTIRAGEISSPETNRDGSPIAVPGRFVELAQAAALHRDPGRFALLYRLLWRLRDERGLLDDAFDRDVARLGELANAVDRDIHKMHAFVRFREVVDESGEHFIAWHEPDHHIVEAAAPFFLRRFANLEWTILTPEVSAHWDNAELRFGPGATRSDAPGSDQLEELWRGYYASIFNPARVNPGAMQAEMPKRFWPNLPEARLIRPLIRQAAGRTREMMEKAPAAAVHRRGAEEPARDISAPDLAGLEAIRAKAAQCRACPLWAAATQTVFGEGPPDARVMFVGEQPGDSEDLRGRPFVGPAGQVFDRALAEAGIDRAGVYVTNAVKHFKFVPRGKRRIHQKPGSVEIHACSTWLEREIEHVAPELVIALGATASQALFGRPLPIARNRGRFLPLGARKALVTVHPSYLLRLPDEEMKQKEFRALVADLGLVRQYR